MTEEDTSSIASTLRPFTFAGFPGPSWAYAIRIWLAVILALYVSFWLELDAPSSAAITVAILALPTRGQGLNKAVFRLLATGLGVAASFVIVGVFAQSGVIMLWVFAAWIGLCVFVVGTLDGNRAYAASLGVTTVAIVAIEQIDAPQQVFDAGIARGSAIVIGVLAITFINDILGAPDHHPKVFAKLKSLQDRVMDSGWNALRGQAMPAQRGGSAARCHRTAVRHRKPGERIEQRRGAGGVGQGGCGRTGRGIFRGPCPGNSALSHLEFGKACRGHSPATR